MRHFKAGAAGLLAIAVLSVMNASTVFADSISPDSFTTGLAVGESTTLIKTVTVSKVSAAPIDVFFLVDTTGSMGGVIDAIKTGFASIVTSLSSVASNIAFGVGEYKDTGDAYVYRENVDLTTNTTDVQNLGLTPLGATGGGDLPEGNVFGLQHVGTDTSWRAGSQRLVVWVGDAPGHNPASGATEVSAIAALNAVGADVYAASAESGPGLNAACGGADCTAGQANRIVAGVGGSFLGTFNPSTIVAALTSALTTGISTYSSVSLGFSGPAPAGVTVGLPAAITGSFDRSIDRVFNFAVTFTGATPGVYDFSIAGLVDGRPIAFESDHITVAGDTAPVPEPATVMLFGTGLAGLVAKYRRSRQGLA